MTIASTRNLPTQARFLAAVSLLNPEVLRSLRELSEAQVHLPSRQELKHWAQQWNLTAGWVVEWIHHTVKWQREGPSRRWSQFYHPLWRLRARFERRPVTINEVIQRRIRGIEFGDWVGNPRHEQRPANAPCGRFSVFSRNRLKRLREAPLVRVCSNRGPVGAADPLRCRSPRND